MRKLVRILPILVFLLLFPLSAQAGEISRLYVWSADMAMPADGSMPASAVQWYKRGNARYLFLPSGLDCSALRLHIVGSDYITVDGQRINDLDITNIFLPGKTVTVSSGNNQYNIHVMQSSETAGVFLKTDSGSINYISESKRNHESGYLYITDSNGNTAYGNSFDYIRVRGNYSFYPYKKSFHIKLLESAPILGMPSAKTWLLIASYADNSMLRNPMTLDLASAAGMAYTSQYRFADVYINTVYYGTYMFCEKIQVGKNRVAVPDLEKETESINDKSLDRYSRLGTNAYQRNTMKYFGIPNDPEDITGGYLMQLELKDRYTSSASGFVTSHGQAVILKSPEYTSKSQTEYIRNLVQSFENAVWAEDGIDPVSGRHYAEIADMSSLVGKYLIEEISKNVDGNKSSYYIYKYNDSVSDKLFFGPVWDYDIAWGNYTAVYYRERNLTSGKGLMTGIDDYERFYWFPRLYARDDFRQAVKEAYLSRFRPCLEVLLGLKEPDEDSGGLMSLDNYALMLQNASEMNFTRWKTFNAKEFSVRTGADYAENIEYLRTFITDRMQYLDSLWLENLN